MKDYTSYLEDTIFCNDRSGSTSGYGAYTRTYSTKIPTLNCNNASDRYTVSTSNGNGKLTYPVGILTADEVVYAGGVYNASNYSYYLYTGQKWWTMSPSYYDASGSYEWSIDPSGNLYYQHRVNDTTIGLRPSVSLKYGIFFTGGDGTSSSPYVVE